MASTHQTKGQKETVSRVMHEFKHGELRIGGNGPKVKNGKQAIAIALREAGASNQESEKDNAKAFRRTKAKERKGETAQAEKEGKAAAKRTAKAATARKSDGDGKTRADLYAEAKTRDIPGRSRMPKAELAEALRH